MSLICSSKRQQSLYDSPFSSVDVSIDLIFLHSRVKKRKRQCKSSDVWWWTCSFSVFSCLRSLSLSFFSLLLVLWDTILLLDYHPLSITHMRMSCRKFHWARHWIDAEGINITHIILAYYQQVSVASLTKEKKRERKKPHVPSLGFFHSFFPKIYIPMMLTKDEKYWQHYLHQAKLGNNESNRAENG